MAGTIAVSQAFSRIFQVTLTPTAVPANSIASETYTTGGDIGELIPEQMVLVRSAGTGGLPNGLIIINAEISAIGTLLIRYFNPTNASISPGATVFNVVCF